jgi:acetolactate synthase-1/2/3 large subunit
MNKIVHVDVDPQELKLSRESMGSESILCDAEVFLRDLAEVLESRDLSSSDRLRAWRKVLTDRLISEMGEIQGAQDEASAGLVNSHSAVSAFLRDAKAQDILVIDGGGTALYSGFQAAPLGKFHKIVSLNAISSMGTAPGQMLGALKASSIGRVIGLIGDGSFVMALNALPSIASEPRALLIVISNGGYLAIRHTQERFLGRRFLGTWTNASEKLPSVRELARSLGFNYVQYSRSETPGIQSVMERFEQSSKATILEIFTDVNQPPLWSVSSKLDAQTRKLSPGPLSRMDYLGMESND